MKPCHDDAAARLDIPRLDEARSDLREAAKLDPTNTAVKKELVAVKKQIETARESQKKALSKAFSGGGGLLGAVFGPATRQPDAVTVREVMSANPITIASDATLAEAARVMATNSVKRLPIIETDGSVVGVLSRADIVAAFARPDELIDDEIREDIAKRVLFVDPESLDISVNDGIVALGGELPTKTDARILEELCRRLEGVVSIDSSLTWKVDDTKLPA